MLKSILAALIVTLILLSFGYEKSSATTSTSTEPVLTHQQEVYLSVLEFCESRGRSKIKILDSNKKYSYGSFQFQMSTFLHYGKKYNLIPVDTDKEDAEKGLIYDFILQRKIVHLMLKDSLYNNWKVCYHKINAPYPKDTDN